MLVISSEKLVRGIVRTVEPTKISASVGEFQKDSQLVVHPYEPRECWTCSQSQTPSEDYFVDDP